MNISDIKNIDLSVWLIENGFNHIQGTLYINPFREDKNSSFSVFINNKNNMWHWVDHGTSEHGNIIDLFCKLYNCSVSDVVKKFNNITSNSCNIIQLQPQNKIKNKTQNNKKEFEIIKIQDLQNKALLEYLQKRKIDINLSLEYLKEIYYKHNSKSYFALAFKNDSNNYEIRNLYFKGCIGSKNITTIKGIDLTKVSIFEGFMDYLTALTYFKIKRFKGTVIVLNSVSLINRTIPLLKDKIVYAFLDNDKAGNEAIKTIRDNNINITDCSNYYKNYKDFNDLLINTN